jgi:hypothetical protein
MFRGANLAIEDACATVSVLREAASHIVSGQVTVSEATRATTHTLQELRLSRRQAVARTSRGHAEHVASGGEAALQAETADWTGEPGGRVPRGQWRESLRNVWCGWPRADACASAARTQLRHSQARAQSCAYSTDASAVGGKDERSLDQTASLMVETATTTSFRPFGRLVGITEDGDLYVAPLLCESLGATFNCMHSVATEHTKSIYCVCSLFGTCAVMHPGRYGDDDAQLAGFGGNVDVDGGLPRLYLMRLHGPRPLEVSTITKHNRVTQCLGALSATEQFFLVLHEPTNDESPTLAGAYEGL